MALMYPWATKEYLLWKMSLGQIIMYHNLGFDQLNPSKENESSSLANMSHEELKKIRDDMLAQGLIEKQKEENLKKDGSVIEEEQNE
jgi:predicted transcriptional regulator